MDQLGYPKKQGLYDPRHEHDACGTGFVVDIKGRKSHDIVQKAIQVLLNLEHRGAVGSEKNTGDGAGILLQMPHLFLAAEAARLKIELPPPGQYAVGMVFLPTEEESRAECEKLFAEIVEEEGQAVLGWRSVPTDNSSIGFSAKASEPVIRQLFIGRGEELSDDLAFERKLCVIRKRISQARHPRARHVLHFQSLLPDDCLQGNVDCQPTSVLLS
jgi:glutamate synthase (ferredoxin)